MSSKISGLAAASLLFAACGGSGGSAAPPALAYDVPAQATVVYETVDSSVVDIDAMGQILQTQQSSSSTVSATFSRGESGVAVTMSYDDFSARMSQPMGAPMTADESGIDGDLSFSLDRMGNVTIGTTPELKGNAALLFSGLGTAHTFFPGLPGTGVSVGDMWTDTVSYSGAEGLGEVAVTVVSEYTVAGDTVVDGRSMMRIDVVSRGANDAVGSVEGMDVEQNLTGTAQGHILWDMQAGIMYERVLRSEGEGSMSVSMAPMAMSIMSRGKSVVRARN